MGEVTRVGPVKRGEVIVLRGYNVAVQQEVVGALRAVLPDNVTLVIVDRDQDIEHLDEAQMAECGWYRSKTVLPDHVVVEGDHD